MYTELNLFTEDITYLAPHFYLKDKNGEKMLNWKSIAGMNGVSLIVVCSYFQMNRPFDFIILGCHMFLHHSLWIKNIQMHQTFFNDSKIFGSIEDDSEATVLCSCYSIIDSFSVSSTSVNYSIHLWSFGYSFGSTGRNRYI